MTRTEPALPKEQRLIREFIQALAEEIEATKPGTGHTVVTAYNGSFVQREGPFCVYLRGSDFSCKGTRSIKA